MASNQAHGRASRFAAVFTRRSVAAVAVVALALATPVAAALSATPANAASTGIDPALGYDPVADLGSPTNVASIIGAGSAYAAGLTGKGIDVAVVDSGVTPVGPLAAPGKVINGPDLSFDSQAPNLRYLDGFGHGTHMAALIAGQQDPTAPPGPSQFTGVAPGARIVNVKAGAHDGAVDVSQVIAAIDWVVQHRNDNGMNIRVLNLSFGTESTQSYLTDPLAYAAEQAWRHGIVVVVSGGNDGKAGTTLADPAYDPNLIAVGADDPMGTVGTSDDQPASFTSRGNLLRHVDVIAPGKSVISARDPGSVIDLNFPTARVGTAFFRGSGTSQAAAVTSGAVALLLQQRPWLTPDQVKSILMSSATTNTIISTLPILGGRGIINVARAMKTAPPLLTLGLSLSSGTGSLENARGTSAHLVDPLTGVTLTGEQDIMGHAWNGSQWAGTSWSGSAWNGGSWNGSQWAGSQWAGTSWSGTQWAGHSWSGSAWNSYTWSSTTWSGSQWAGGTWSGSQWAGGTWSGSQWAGGTWSGSQWAGGTWSGADWS